MARIQCQRLSIELVLLLHIVSCHWSQAAAEVDADKGAEISRWIREHFRATGMNWVSPKMLKEEVNLATNTKPIMYLFTMRSCADCRLMMDDFKLMDPILLSGLSSQFHAVLVLDDYQTEFGPEFAPGGADYVPRMIFANPQGVVIPDLINKGGDPKQPYIVATGDEVVDSMQRVLAYHQQQVGSSIETADLLEDI